MNYGVWVLGGKLGRKRVTPLETRNSRREPPQRGGAGSRPRAKFEHMIAERISRDDPRKQMVARDPLPEARRTKPVFECVHFAAPVNGVTSLVDHRHHDFGIARAGNRAVRSHFFDPAQVVFGQFHVG